MRLVFGTIAFVGFIIAIGLSLKPVYISPLQNSKLSSVWAKENIAIYRSYLVSAVAILVLVLADPIVSIYQSTFSFWYRDNDVSLFQLLLITVPILIVLAFLLWHLYRGLKGVGTLTSSQLIGFKSQYSLRPLHCVHCRNKLKKIYPPASHQFLNHPEQIAIKIGSVSFEMWCCPHCNEQPNRQSIVFLRGIHGRFENCLTCNERTMRLTSTREGEPYEKIQTYTCQCCSKTKEIIIHEDDGGD